MASNIITCFSAGDSEYKDITLPSSTTTCPDRLVIRFQNANEYGETTAATPTHPKLRVYNNEETLLKTAEICDSTGHYAGQGCYDDDFIIEFMLVDDNNETLALIKNSDIREKTANSIIKSDGSFEKWLKNVQKTNYTDYAFSLVPSDFGLTTFSNCYVEITSSGSYQRDIFIEALTNAQATIRVWVITSTSGSQVYLLQNGTITFNARVVGYL